MVAGYAPAQPGYGLLHARRRDDGRFVGGCGLFPVPDGDDIEIAYRLPVDCWGQGYATEMAGAVLAHGFGTLGLARIVGLTWPENVASQRVLRKIGMREHGVETHYGRDMLVFVAERSVRVNVRQALVECGARARSTPARCSRTCSTATARGSSRTPTTSSRARTPTRSSRWRSAAAKASRSRTSPARREFWGLDARRDARRC